MYKLTSVSTAPDTGLSFSASIEGTNNNPWFGTQFLPDKTMATFNNSNINHSTPSIKLNRYLADNFLKIARQNDNTSGYYADV